MLDDPKPPYNPNIPLEEYQYNNVEPNGESNFNYSNGNISQNNLGQTSTDIFNDNGNPFLQQPENEQNNLYNSYNPSFNNNQPSNNNINEKIISQSYSFSPNPIQNNPFNYSTNQNNSINTFSSVRKINPQPISYSYNNQYNNINSYNNVYSYSENNNHIQNGEEEIIEDQNLQPEEIYEENPNIYYSMPIPQNHISISNYPNQSNTVNYSYNPNNINNIQNHASVVHINDENLKDPEMSRIVEECQKKVDDYVSERKKSLNNSLKKSNYFLKNSQNSEFNNNNFNKNKSFKNSQNNNFNISTNLDDMDFEKFSPDFWKNFYDINEPFFNQPINESIKHNETIINNDKNEIYKGDVNMQNQKHGLGKMITNDYKRIGNWKNNIFHGWGREIKNGIIYEGRFENGKLKGKGIIKDGDVLYVGEIINYLKYGKGEIFTSSYHYVGNFINDSFDGKGRIEIYDEGIYEGNFNNGEINGYGVFKYNDGKYYEGEMKNGKMDGDGKLIFPNGNIIDGIFANGEFFSERKNKNNY